MKSLLITNKGCEESAKKELDIVFGIKNHEIADYGVKFEAENYEKLIEICYKSQSAAKILILIDEFDFKSIEEIKKHAEKAGFEEYFAKDSAFSCRAAVFENDVDKQELESELGDSILKKIKRKVDLENPDLQFYALIVRNKCYFGIDFAGIDLSQREYKLFTGRDDLKGNVAFSLLMIAGYKKGEIIIDPFMKNGLIPIEAALFSLNFPVNYYQKDKFLFRKFPKLEKFDFDAYFEKIDKKIREENTEIYGFDSLLRNVKAAQKNAKVAGILKRINLTRVDVEWIDTKFKEGEIDRIVTVLPRIAKFSNKQAIEKHYREFFDGAKYALKKEGKIVLISNAADLIKSSAGKNDFKIAEKKNIWQGSLALDVFIIEKK